MPNIIGRLERWRIVNRDEGFEIFGHLFDDVLGRFPDDTFFHTTKISTPIEEFISGNVVESQNCFYLLGKKVDDQDSYFLVNGVCVKGEKV